MRYIVTKKSKKHLALWGLKPVIGPVTSQEKLTYSSSNKKIATVSSKGVVKGKRKGVVTITVKSGKVTKKIKITVK